MPSPLSPLSSAEMARYSRHLLLPEIGVEGQQQLAAAKVLVVGAGGLGSPALLYLAAAGVGTLGVADFDQVETHNLQRQLLHDTASVGTDKVVSAAARLRALNPHIRVIEHPAAVDASNAVELFSQYDAIVDGTDRLSIRYLCNDAAHFAKRPLVHGSIFRFEGQVSVFHTAAGGPCYRCLFPAPPSEGAVPGCGETGVLGALCGVVGSLQALETLKLIVGIGRPLIGRVLTYEALNQEFNTLTLAKDPQCPLCGETPTILDLRADTSPPKNSMPNETIAGEVPLEVSVSEAHCLLHSPGATALLVDVREPYELQICRVDGSRDIPLRQLPTVMTALPRDRHLLILCHSGMRSLRATQFLREQGFSAVSSVTGGIDAWAETLDPAMARY